MSFAGRWRVLLPLAIGCRTALDSPAASAPSDAWARYDALLSEVVTAEGFVDYDALEDSRRPLDEVVRYMAEHRVTGSEQERLATWINAYNALVLFAVLAEGRPASVKDVRGTLPVGGSGFFVQRTFALDGTRYSLWNLEHGQIRGNFPDYRVHAALNCASASCPALRASLYEAATLDEQLEEQMRAWVNDPERGVRVVDGQPLFSPIFSWYSSDFRNWSGGQTPCAVAARHAESELAAVLEAHEARGCPLNTFDYDWSLNHRAAASPEFEASSATGR